MCAYSCGISTTIRKNAAILWDLREPEHPQGFSDSFFFNCKEASIPLYNNCNLFSEQENCTRYLNISIYPELRPTHIKSIQSAGYNTILLLQTTRTAGQLSFSLEVTDTASTTDIGYKQRSRKQCPVCLLRSHCNSYNTCAAPGARRPASSTTRHRARLHRSVQLACLFLRESSFSSQICSFFFFSLFKH